MEERVESPNLETRKMMVKLMPRQLKAALLKDFTPPPKLFLFAIYAFTGDSFECAWTSQEHNAFLLHARGKVSIFSEIKLSSRYSEKKGEKLEGVFFSSTELLTL